MGMIQKREKLEIMGKKPESIIFRKSSLVRGWDVIWSLVGTWTDQPLSKKGKQNMWFQMQYADWHIWCGSIRKFSLLIALIFSVKWKIRQLPEKGKGSIGGLKGEGKV